MPGENRGQSCAVGRGKMLRGWRKAVVAGLLGGGTLFDACQVRLHDAVIAGTKDLVSILLDPANVLGDELNDSAP